MSKPKNRTIFAILAITVFLFSLHPASRSKTPVIVLKRVIQIAHPSGSVIHHRTFQTLLRRYQKESQDTIVFTQYPSTLYLNSLLRDFAQGKAYDLLMLENWHAPYLVEQGMIRALDDRITSAFPDYPDPITDMVKIDNDYFALPFSASTFAIFCNLDLLGRYNAEPPQTWSELEIASGIVSRRGTNGLAIPASDPTENAKILLALYFTASSDIYQMDAPQGIAFLEMLQNMSRAKSLSDECINWNQSDVTKLFLEEKVAMMIADTAQIHEIHANQPNFKWIARILPTLEKNGTVHGLLVGESIALSSPSIHSANAATDFLSFILSEQQKTRWHDIFEQITPQAGNAHSYLPQTYVRLSPYLSWVNIVDVIHQSNVSIFSRHLDTKTLAHTLQEQIRNARFNG